MSKTVTQPRKICKEAKVVQKAKGKQEIMDRLIHNVCDKAKDGPFGNGVMYRFRGLLHAVNVSSRMGTPELISRVLDTSTYPQ